jgi:hypothetical protein
MKPEPNETLQTYTVDPSSSPRRRLECFLLNYLSRPSLLQTTPVTTFFPTYPSETMHFTERLNLSNSLHEYLFRDALLDTFPELHHIDIRISTAVRYSPLPPSLLPDFADEEEKSINGESERKERRGEWQMLHILDGRCFDAKNNLLFIEGDSKLPTPFMKVFQFGPKVDKREIWRTVEKYRDLYTWECVVEYLRIWGAVNWFGGDAPTDPLEGLGIFGEGTELRRIEDGGGVIDTREVSEALTDPFGSSRHLGEDAEFGRVRAGGGSTSFLEANDDSETKDFVSLRDVSWNGGM